MRKEKYGSVAEQPEGRNILRISREDKVLGVRVRELAERFGIKKPEDVATVMRISITHASHLITVADIRSRW